MVYSLEQLLYNQLYTKFTTKNDFDNLNQLSLFLNYSYKHHRYLFIYLLNDLLSNLNKNNAIHMFTRIHSLLSNYMSIIKINLTLCHFTNNCYFKHPLFGKLLLNRIDSTEKNNYSSRFNKFTYNLFDTFNWKNVVVAGGSIFKILNTNNDFDNKLNTDYKYSDIDLFLYGQTKTKKEKVIYILNYLYTKFKKNMWIINNTNVLTILSPHYPREIQIITGSYKTPLQILNDFDVSHLQLCFNGSYIQMTDHCSQSIKHKCSSIMKYKINDNLIYKIASANYKLHITHDIEKEYTKIIDKYTFKWNNDISTFIEVDPLDHIITIFKEKQKDYISFINKKHITYDINPDLYNIDKLKNELTDIIKNNREPYASIPRIFYINPHNKYGFMTSIEECLDSIYLNFSGDFNSTNFYLTRCI